MREAVGGSLLLYLVIPIIIIFILFIGFIMNYAAAYRAANYVVTQIENCQGQMSNCGSLNADWKDTLYQTIKSKYSYIEPNQSSISPCYIVNGVNGSSSSYVFRIELPISFEIPLIGVLKPMVVKAETKSINGVPAKYLAEFSKCK